MKPPITIKWLPIIAKFEPRIFEKLRIPTGKSTVVQIYGYLSRTGVPDQLVPIDASFEKGSSKVYFDIPQVIFKNHVMTRATVIKLMVRR